MEKHPEIEKTADIRLIVEHRFDVAPERVFDAWLDPQSVGCWLFATPEGVMNHIEINPRVGGTFIISEYRGDVLAEHFGTYVEIDRPRRIVFSFTANRQTKPTLVEIRIMPDGRGCRLSLTHCIDPQWIDYKEKTKAGWTMILDSLDRCLKNKEV